jgi:hypothetical protein
MEGGEVVWKNDSDMPTLPLQRSRAIFRDIVNGLDYRKFNVSFILYNPYDTPTMNHVCMFFFLFFSALSRHHSSGHQACQSTCT